MAVKLHRDLLDELTEKAAVISTDHNYIHKGRAYTAYIDTGSISSAYRIGFTTPEASDEAFIHWRPIGVSTSADYIKFELTEGDSFTSGTDVTPRNRNRNFTDASNMQVFSKGVTSTPSGPVIDHDGLGASGNPASRSGGGSGENEELLLKPDTDYVITLTPDGATTCLLKLFWYEEEGYAIT